jgi:hypothetical protein
MRKICVLFGNQLFVIPEVRAGVGFWRLRSRAPSRFITGATFSARRREVGGACSMARALVMADRSYGGSE